MLDGLPKPHFSHNGLPLLHVACKVFQSKLVDEFWGNVLVRLGYLVPVLQSHLVHLLAQLKTHDRAVRYHWIPLDTFGTGFWHRNQHI